MEMTDFLNVVREKTCGKQDTTETKITDRKAQMAACEITHCQSKERGCGVLVYDQHVKDSELSKYSIITSSKVIQKEDFAVGDYEVKFSKETKIKTFDLKNVTKSVRHVASAGLVVIFIESSYSGFKHVMGLMKCSILSKLPLTVAGYDQSQQLFCYVGSQCYNVESNGESGEYVLKAVSDKSDTTAKSANASDEIPNGTAILQGADENVKAVGILNVVDDKPMVISPIWLKSSIADILDGVTTAYHASPSGNPEPTVASADASNGEPSDHANGELPTDGNYNPEPTVASADASNGEPPDHANGELPTDGNYNPEPTVASADASNGEPSDHANGELPTDGNYNPEPPVASAGASNGEPPGHVNGLSTDGRTTVDRESPPNNKDLPSLTGFPTQEEQKETSYNNEDFLVSETIAGNKSLQDMLALSLDYTSNPLLIKTWEHLAEELNISYEIRLKCKLTSAHSCTMMLFEALAAEDKVTTVKDLITGLETIGRMTLAKDLLAYAEREFRDFFNSPDSNELITTMADKLDEKSRVNKYWRHLGSHFKLCNKRLEEIENGPFNPTQLVMEYLYRTKAELTIGMFYDVVKGGKKLKDRQDVFNILKPLLDKCGRDALMKDVIKLDSVDAMRDICLCFNTTNPTLANWKHLASAFGIPRDIYQSLNPVKPMGPTVTLFEWIFVNKSDLTVGQLYNALRKIERNTLAERLRNHFRQNKTGQM